MPAEQYNREAEETVPDDDAVMIEDVTPVRPAVAGDEQYSGLGKHAANADLDTADTETSTDVDADADMDDADEPAPASVQSGTGRDTTPDRDSGLDRDTTLDRGAAHDRDPGWQRIQASFIDDPRGSVVEAAALVEKTAQMFVATIQERERSLRGAWEHNGAGSDTELLRTTLRDYRALYEQISQV